MLTLLLLALAVFLTWETLKSLFPYRMPSWLHGILVLALAYEWTFVPIQWLTVAAVAGAVGILHTLVGASDASKPSLSLRRRKLPDAKRHKVPELPD